MKNLLLLFALCTFALVACETDSTEQSKGKLTLTSAAIMEFSEAGGAGEITFAFVDEATRANEVTATATAAWITDITVGESNVTFNVAANNDVERTANIKVECGTQSFQVMAIQAGSTSADVNFTATHMGGTYYGKFIVEGGQTEGFNYHIIMSDHQPSLPNAYNGYTEYRFDIYAGECAEFNREVRIPVGTYTLDHQRTNRVGTIDAYENCSYHVSANQVKSNYRTCTLVVTEDSIIADLTFFNGESHHVEFHGAPVMEDYSETTYADVYPVSPFTSDHTFDVNGGYMYAYYRGDWFGTGDDVWFMHMIEDKTTFDGVYLIFNFIVPKSVGGFNNTEGFIGEYTLSDPSKELEWTFPAGRLRDDSQMLNAFYMECVSGQIDWTHTAPIVDGTIKVEKVDGEIVITVDGKDDASNKINGTFRGYVRELENQGTVIK